MKRVHLVNTGQFEVGAGVIIKMSTGVEFANQVGGMSCNHVWVEGIFIPVTDVGLPHDERICGAGSGPLPLSYVALVQELFEKAGLPFEVDMQLAGEECWIPFVVKENVEELWGQFAGHVGYYTTADNCD
jgi:hypothetical protein